MKGLKNVTYVSANININVEYLYFLKTFLFWKGLVNSGKLLCYMILYDMNQIFPDKDDRDVQRLLEGQGSRNIFVQDRSFFSLTFLEHMRWNNMKV